ncbi:hypothetical protein B0H19DRAFT_1062411 [Mycena capillaripes]|nr:hypothetical protein B0H19DRAFT_1062411 [Mycena capillaripes]
MSTNRTIDNETSPQWQDAMPVSGSSSLSLPVADGPSHNKGKGPDPRNWGAVGSLVDFSEQELEAQHDAFENFAKINRMVKQEKRAESTPRVHVPNVGLKPPINILKVNLTVSDPLPENKSTTKPGQADAERIAELERELSRLRQSELPDCNIADSIRRGNAARKSSSTPREATPSRIAAGSFLDKAICGAARLNQNPPSSEPSDSSSSSGSKPSSSNADESPDIGCRRSTSTHQTTLPP